MSEEDDEYFLIQDAISGLQIAEDRLSEEGCTHLLESIKKSELWLKSIKPNHWKPSEEQMEALKNRTHGLHTSSETRKILESLINDLEKL